MINIQNEVQKIHSQFGMSEMALYKIQLLCYQYAKESKQFKPITDELPPLGVECLLQNDKWIHLDFNPKGIRIGYRCDLSGWVSAYFCSQHDCYMTRQADEDNDNFELSKAEDQIPTHWRHY